MAQKKVGFTQNSNIQGDKLIINNGVTASVSIVFEGSNNLDFKWPTSDGTSGMALKTDGAGNLSFGVVAVSVTSGTSGTDGSSGTSGTSGSSGSSGTSGTSGSSGSSGSSGANGTSGSSGTSGTTGATGASGTSGSSGSSGTSGSSGSSGINGTSGTNGSSGTSGANGVGNATMLGTTNTVAKFTGATAVGNSTITDDGTTITIKPSGVTSSIIASGLSQFGTFIGFVEDADSGLWRQSENNIHLVTNNVSRINIGAGPISINSTSTISFGDGTQASPILRFTLDNDTGIYRSAANTMNFAAGGENVAFVTSAGLNISATASDNSLQFRTRNDGVVDFGILNGASGLTITRYNSTGTFVDSALVIGKPEGDGGVLFRDGSSATPSISFQSDTNTGLFRVGAEQIGLAANSTHIATFDRSGVTNRLNILNSGSNLESNLRLESDNGAKFTTIFFRGDGTTSNFGILSPGGTSSTPATRFRLVNADTTTNGVRVAIGENTLDVINIGANSNPASGYKVKITGKLEMSDVIGLSDGTLATPTLNFTSDTDTGLYRIGSGRIGFASNGILLANTLSNESDIIQARAGVTASNNVAYHYALATSGGDGRWKIGLDGADNTILRLDRWSGGSYTNTFMRVTSSTASVNYRTYFTSAVNHQPVVNASVSGTYSIDMSASNVFNLTLTGNTTLTTSNQYEGSYIIRVKQDGTGNRSLTLNPDGRFIGTSALSIGTASNDISVIQLVHIGTQSIVTSQKNLTTL